MAIPGKIARTHKNETKTLAFTESLTFIKFMYRLDKCEQFCSWLLYGPSLLP